MSSTAVYNEINNVFTKIHILPCKRHPWYSGTKGVDIPLFLAVTIKVVVVKWKQYWIGHHVKWRTRQEDMKGGGISSGRKEGWSPLIRHSTTLLFWEWWGSCWKHHFYDQSYFSFAPRTLVLTTYLLGRHLLHHIHFDKILSLSYYHHNFHLRS